MAQSLGRVRRQVVVNHEDPRALRLHDIPRPGIGSLEGGRTLQRAAAGPLRAPLILALCLVLVANVEGILARPAQRDGRSVSPNTWTARSSTGLTLGGTWTATPDPATGTVRGAWTLLDARGGTVAQGAWSAAKSPSGWTGSWRAVAAGRPGEYSGTWSARTQLEPGAGFAELFKQAVKGTVGGQWRARGLSGAWSIRVFESEPRSPK